MMVPEPTGVGQSMSRILDAVLSPVQQQRLPNSHLLPHRHPHRRLYRVRIFSKSVSLFDLIIFIPCSPKSYARTLGSEALPPT